jgi:hypothetical protein
MHYRDLRLRNNAGMDFPLCYSMTTPLDTDKGRLPTTGNLEEVTCKRCRALESHGFRQAPEPDPFKLWASYVSNTAHGVSGIALHSSYRAALETVAGFYDVEDLGKSDEEVYQEIEEAAGSEAWHISEVELP